MPIGYIFWLLMILWLIFGFMWYRTPTWQFGLLGNGFLLFFLLFLLGWHDFGFVLQGR